MHLLLLIHHVWHGLLAARSAARHRAEFARLGPRDLHDLGLGQDEFESCLLEAEGRIEATRLRLACRASTHLFS